MTRALRGLLGPVVTTFSTDGELDLAAFTANVRAHVAAGLDGVVVGGSTGEAPLLDERERGALIEAARAVVPRDRVLLAGTGAESTRQCVRLTRLAAERGADAVLVVAPHYYGSVMTFDALDRHYRTVADASPVPVVLYNIPKYMHFSIAPSVVQNLASHPNIIGIKDSSGNLELLAAYLNAPAEHFAVLTGNGSTLERALQIGARGGVLAVGLFATPVALAVLQAAQSGDAAAASAGQERLTRLNGRIVGELGIAGIKAALELVGLHGGPLRSPLQPLNPAERAEVAALLRQTDLLPAG